LVYNVLIVIFTEEVLNSLRNYRMQAGLSTRQLEDKAKVSRRTIMRAENGQSNPEPLTWRKLANALDTTPEALQSPPAAKFNIEVNPDEAVDVDKLITAYRRNPAGVMSVLIKEGGM
jgi:transcriptional regulator with XRE-family HTH domain